MPAPTLSVVAAIARDGGIGLGGALLTRLPEDLRRFKALTMGAPIVMGRKTWQSIGRALPGRRNIVVSRDPDWRSEGAVTATSLEAALAGAASAPKVFVIGGAEVYALALPLADELELTEIDAVFPADAYFPTWDRADFAEVARVPMLTPDGIGYSFVSYRRRRRATAPSTPSPASISA